VREVVVKVLRELRQHALSTAFEEGCRRKRAAEVVDRPEVVVRFAPGDDLDDVRAACTRSYALQTVFTRDLVAAHLDGVLMLGGLEAPQALEACLVSPMRSTDELLARIEESAALAGQTLVLDGVEHVLARSLAGHKRVSRARLDEAARSFGEALGQGLRLAGRRAIVNLNVSSPVWASAVEGPLFLEKDTDPGRASSLADALAGSLLEGEASRIRIDWHLTEPDLVPQASGRLLPLARRLLARVPVRFVFDRARQAVGLGEGIDRGHPAVLLSVALNLPRLANLITEKGNDQTTRLRDKLRSLARLALSAALQKREYLRRHSQDHPGLASGFLLERARLLVAPLGLDEAVRLLQGEGLCASEEALALGTTIFGRLRDVLQEEGRASSLETCLDAVPEHDAGGPTCWDSGAPMKAQLRVLGELHGAARAGSGVAFLPHDPPPTAEQVLGWLRWAWSHTSVVRLELRNSRPPLRQMTFPDA
jgi:hypothetical protein